MPYVTQSPDTSEAAERAQIEVLRRLGMGKRVQIMQKLSKTQRGMAWAALKNTHPELTEEELKIKAVAVWYGEELSNQFAAALRKRANET